MLEQMNPDRSKRKYSRYYRPAPHTNSYTDPAGGYRSPRVRPAKPSLLDWFKLLFARVR